MVFATLFRHYNLTGIFLFSVIPYISFADLVKQNTSSAPEAVAPKVAPHSSSKSAATCFSREIANCNGVSLSLLTALVSIDSCKMVSMS